MIVCCSYEEEIEDEEVDLDDLSGLVSSFISRITADLEQIDKDRIHFRMPQLNRVESHVSYDFGDWQETEQSEVDCDSKFINEFDNEQAKHRFGFQNGFKCFHEDDVLEVLRETLDELTDLFGKVDIAVLMGFKTKWNKFEIENSWFNLADSTKVKLGYTYNKTLDSDSEVNVSKPDKHEGYCVICYEELTKETKFSLSCGHEFCRQDWFEYLKNGLETCDGIEARCMQSKCNLKVGHNEFLEILELSKIETQKYWKWLAKSFIELNSEIKFCPTEPWCKHFIERDRTTSKLAVKCLCGNLFCFECEKSTHRPADCDLADKWMVKYSKFIESDTKATLDTIMTIAKRCPVCKTLTEKSSGCNHMTCMNCARTKDAPTHWCWLCRDHGVKVETYKHICNNVESAKIEEDR